MAMEYLYFSPGLNKRGSFAVLATNSFKLATSKTFARRYISETTSLSQP